MNKIKLKYDPNLSVRENAVRCGVSESAIRKFIRTNGIDRNYDNKVAKKRAILTLKEENPSISLAEMAHRLGYSVNTIRKYLQMDLGQSKITTSKVSTFDLSNKKFIINILGLAAIKSPMVTMIAKAKAIQENREIAAS